jgi:hypothetical protein
LDGGFYIIYGAIRCAVFSDNASPEVKRDYTPPSQNWREYERRIVMKQDGNKKLDLLIYIGIFLFCAFLIYQMLTPHR